MRRFGTFVAIDWSGAVGEALPGIAVARCRKGEDAPTLVPPPVRHWSRPAVLGWLLDELPSDSLVGFDLGFSLPFADRGAFLPGWEQSPTDAPGLWTLVETLSAADPHLAAGSFVDHPDVARHLRRHGGRQGDRFEGGRGRLRVTERAQAAMGLLPVSNLNLVGAAQVGRASFTGMRLLHRLRGRLAIWPFDPLPAAGPVAVEIYTALAAVAAGRSRGRSKMRTWEEVDAALAVLGSRRTGGRGALDDHRADALVTAAWLRVASHDAALWAPPGLDAVRATEGWTFGAR